MKRLTDTFSKAISKKVISTLPVSAVANIISGIFVLILCIFHLNEIGMKFKAKRGIYIKVLIVVLLVAPAFLIGFVPEVLEKPVIVALLFVPSLLFVWIYLDTSYVIDNGKLFYRSGFIRGNISIKEIQKVVKGKTAWSGVRPATAFNGLLLVSGKGDEVYISPESNDLFLKELLMLNDRIKIVF
jgi:hypothetical protein